MMNPVKPKKRGGARPGSGRPRTGQKKRVSIQVDDETLAALDRAVKIKGISRAALVSLIIRGWIK